MKDFLKKINIIYHEIPIKVLAKVCSKKPDKLLGIVGQNMLAMCKIAEKYTDYFITYRYRPRYTESLPILERKHNRAPKIAIVLQGPIMEKDDFTCESVKFYKKHYPNAHIIVSTWVDENKDLIDRVSNAGAIVVQTEKPHFFGHGNINLQLVNSKTGIFRAKELGSEYVCKTRTDQRIMHADVFEYLINLLNLFPCDNSDFLSKQKSRIICFGMEYGDLFYPFFLSDFFYFGATEDICSLFDSELDYRENVGICDNVSRRLCAQENRVSEIQIIRQYISRMGGNNVCTIRAYWDFVKNHLICINKDDIGLFWNKYDTKYSEHARNGHFHEQDSEQNLKCYNWDFINWLNLYSGTLEYQQRYEERADIIVRR